jgi:hypothetical protein
MISIPEEWTQLSEANLHILESRRHFWVLCLHGHILDIFVIENESCCGRLSIIAEDTENQFLSYFSMDSETKQAEDPCLASRRE